MDPDQLEGMLLSSIESPELSKSEVDIIKANLGHPAITKYFRIIFTNTLKDLCDNNVDSEDGQKKLILRYAKAQGIQHICSLIVNTYGGKPA